MERVETSSTGPGTPVRTIDSSDLDEPALTWPIRQNPAHASWFGTGIFPGPGENFSRPRAAWDAVMAPELWGPWVNSPIQTGDVRYGLYESVDVSASEITVTVRDDARWSNGDDVLGRDTVPVTIAARLSSASTPLDDQSREPPTTPVDAITGFEWNGKVARFRSEGEWFEEFLPQRLWALLARKGAGWGGVWQHTRLEPYDQWFATLAEHWSQAKQGEIDPWGQG